MKFDWQTVVAAAAILVAVGSLGQKFMQPSAPSQPVVAPVVAVAEQSSARVYDEPRREAPYFPPVRVLPVETNRAGAVASVQLDYDTQRKIVSQQVNAMRKKIRENGVGEDGITEADLDQMLKDGRTIE